MTSTPDERTGRRKLATCWATEMDEHLDSGGDGTAGTGPTDQPYVQDWTKSLRESLMQIMDDVSGPPSPPMEANTAAKTTAKTTANTTTNTTAKTTVDTTPGADERIETKLEVRNGRRVKVVRTYRAVRVPRVVLKRAQWRKFGQSRDDPRGPNSATTGTGEEILMVFVGQPKSTGGGGGGAGGKAGADPTGADDDIEGMKKLQTMGKGMVKCQHCGLDHWSLRCPYRHQLAQLKDMCGSGDVSPAGNQHNNSSGTAPAGDGAPKVAKYVPPSMRAGAAKTAGSDDRGWDRDQEYTLRVTNLPEESTDEDLRDLFRHFGRIKRVYLARDKVTNAAKGFAFVTYLTEVEAERAIAGVHKHRYGNLILYVEWSDK